MSTADGNGFTTKEILVEFRDEVRNQFKDLRDAYAVGHSAHDKRIRSNETSIARLKGAIAVIAFLVTLLVTLAAAYVH